jgi:hypothetical protein
MALLAQSQTQIRRFLSTLDSYEIIPQEDKELYARDASGVTNPALRRELKIKQYKREKELRGRIEVRLIQQESPFVHC